APRDGGARGIGRAVRARAARRRHSVHRGTAGNRRREAVVPDATEDMAGPMDRIDDRLASLVPALQRLDHLIGRAVDAARIAFGRPIPDQFRGLHITGEEVDALLSRGPLGPALALTPEPDDRDAGSPLAWLARRFDLSPFDVDVLIVALAPEIDLRYERLYA